MGRRQGVKDVAGWLVDGVVAGEGCSGGFGSCPAAVLPRRPAEYCYVATIPARLHRRIRQWIDWEQGSLKKGPWGLFPQVREVRHRLSSSAMIE